MKCSLGISNFLEEISSLSNFIFFLYFCIDHLGRLYYLLLLFIGMLPSDVSIFPFLLCLSTSLLFSAICKTSSATILHFCISFSQGWLWSRPPVQCYKPPSEPPSVDLQALRSNLQSIRSNLSFFGNKLFCKETAPFFIPTNCILFCILTNIC